MEYSDLGTISPKSHNCFETRRWSGLYLLERRETPGLEMVVAFSKPHREQKPRSQGVKHFPAKLLFRHDISWAGIRAAGKL